ncbi:hypothetical protein C0989_006113, partial [Termitomyces sp. Mn162]
VPQLGTAYIDSVNGISFWGLNDIVHGVTYGYVFPPLADNSTEFIGEIVAPIDTQWAGVSPTGTMLQSLLLVAWRNGNSICIHPAHPNRPSYDWSKLYTLEMGVSLPELYHMANHDWWHE